MFSKHKHVIAKSGLVKGTLTRLHATNTCYFDNTIRIGQTRKIYPPSYKIEDSTSTKNDRRINDIDIQMLSKSIYTQVFKNKVISKPTATKAEQLLKNLQKHGMIKGKEFEYMPDINFKIPIVLGKDLIEHFQIIGEQQAKPYRDIVLKLLNTIPPVPTKWIMQAGWTRYSVNGESTIVPYPAEDALVFDVEVCVKSGKAPTLATAVSNSAWYAWISPSVLSATCKPVTNHQYSQESLIPLEEQCSSLKRSLQQPRIVVGHNVSYDRARIRDQYKIEQTGMRFLDTMSLHICIAGLTSYQRIVLKSGEETAEDESWKNISSLNNLSDVHKLYCGTEIQKETRNIFLEGSLADIKKDFQDVMAYCARDVQATYSILKKLFPLFLERFPHPVTFAGMLELGTAYLPINSNWERYIEDSQQAYEDLDIEGKLMLARRADQACQLLHNNRYKENIWMWDQDWEVKNLKLKKDLPKTKDIKKITECVSKINVKEEEDFSLVEEVEDTDYLEERFKYLEDTARLLPAIKTLLPGYPNWYRKLCIKPNSSSDWIPGPNLISTSMQITPKLLNLTWEGFPLHFIRGQGWGFLVPSIRNSEQKTTIPLKQIVEKCCVPLTKCVESNNIDIRIDKSVEEYLSKKEYYRSIKKGKTNKGYKGW